MKIAISVPHSIFQETGFVRSQSAYDITQRINAACVREASLIAKISGPTSLEPAFAAAQFKVLSRASW